MKRFTLLLAAATISFTASAQFSDDFESYIPGDWLGDVSADWSTWSGTTGPGGDDVQVVDDKAHSGANALYFASNIDGGGPADVVLPFGGEFNTGQFMFSLWIYVEANKSAYYNFQANSTVGQEWALDTRLDDNGDLELQNTNGSYLKTTYTPDTWFQLSYVIDLNTNSWEFLIDGVSKGTFANPINQISSIDIFPTNSNAANNFESGFWIDDVEFSHTPYTLTPLNAAVTIINDVIGLVGQDRVVSVDVRNLGTDPITSFDLDLVYDGATVTENVSGLNLASLEISTITISNPITLKMGNNPMVATISNVNAAGPDGDPMDDEKTQNIDPVVPAPGKFVIGEEATGTWCGWCVRGAVAMDHMAEYYEGYFQGIAVHNGDPMTDTIYDSWIGDYIGGYPSALLDRGTEFNPAIFESEFMERITEAPRALLTNSSSYNETTRQLEVNIDVEFNTDIADGSGWKVLCVLVEDHVTGTAGGYAQANYYSGGGNGPMGGYENLADPVPAVDMVYDDVARTLQPAPEGESVSTGAITAGQHLGFSYTFDISTDWKADDMAIVGILMDESGLVENGSSSAFELANSVSNPKANDGFQVYPNPTSSTAFVNITLNQPEAISLKVSNIAGLTMMQRTYDQMQGQYLLPVNTSGLSSGLYIIEVQTADAVYTQKLIVE